MLNNPSNRRIIFTANNIFDLDVRAVVNPVNCVGVMGKGLALEFKNRFPDMFEAYKNVCDSKKLKPGKIHKFKKSELVIYNFPTKDHWKASSKMVYIEKGLSTLISQLNKDQPSSLAIPALGCGLGGLNWDDVKFKIIDALKNISYDYNVIYICHPF